jgi:zinc transport system substrate-binding protein
MVGVASALLVACGAGAGRAEDGRALVVAGFYPLAEAAQRIGGPEVEVVNLTPPGVEPHDLELSPDQVGQLEDADLLLYLGGGFQPAVGEVAARRDGPSLDLLAELDLDAEDPHFWLDPRRFAEAVDRIAEAMADLDAESADRAAEYRAELDALDREIGAGLADCARTEIVTAHDAFSYLADRYDLRQIPIAGVSPESEPDPDRLADLTELVESLGVTTVFYESLVSPDLADTLARDAGVDTAVLDPIEGLSEDDIADGATYASVMRDNLAALRAALDCG